MTSPTPPPPSNPVPNLRLWPGVIGAAVIVAGRYLLPWVLPDSAGIAVLTGLLAAVWVVGWWLFASRAPGVERLAAVIWMAVGLWGTSRLVHPSIANGMMGLLLPFYGLPALALALVAWAGATRTWVPFARRLSLALCVATVCAAFLLLRTDGMTGGSGSEFRWRWTPTAEERLLATAPDSPTPGSSAPRPAPASTGPAGGASPGTAVWPGFRGARRAGQAPDVRIGTNWVATPPGLLWKRPVGPGWSSFAVDGDLFYTQEQRGEEEVVACYRVGTGEPVWTHRDRTRFWESNAGAGPRGTPALAHGRVYALGATGVLNALDARTGAPVWSASPVTDTGSRMPEWGFSGSPLALDDTVVVATSGRLAAFGAADGKPRWLGPDGRGAGYSSPHAATLGGQLQVLLVSGKGITGVRPSDGTVLWQHDWPGDAIAQPALTPDGDVLLGSGSGIPGLSTGLRRLAVENTAAGWTAMERWTSRQLRPYFNDFVVHAGHAYGFDGGLLACLDLADGRRAWKDGRYGSGQLILLPEQGLLVVISERGDVALVPAAPDAYRELGRIPAIAGKTWNHPALAGDILLVRNSEEMAALRLPRAER